LADQPTAGHADDTSSRAHGSAVRITGISKTFGPKTVLYPFDWDLQPGRIHALLGQNGSGKSTFIKILTGTYTPDDDGVARVEVDGRQLDFGSPRAALNLGFRVVHQDLGLVGDSSIGDNLAFGQGYKTRLGTIRRKEVRRDSAELLEVMGLAGLDPRMRVNELSAAQKTGVAIARAMRPGASPTTLLILDEPTATLPAREVAHLEQMLKLSARSGTAILYVTHHLDEVFRLADDVTVLRDGRRVLDAPVSGLTHDDLVSALVGSVVEPVRRPAATADAARGDVVLDVAGLEGDALEGVDLQVHRGEIVGLYGLTGSGRESILGTVFGSLVRSAGRVSVAGKELTARRPDRSVRAGVAYLPPDRKRGGGIMTMTATENLTLPSLSEFFRGAFLRPRRERDGAQAWMDKLDVRPAGAARAPLASFSGGNQQKILIGKWMRVAPKVFLLEEPTQGVDVGAKASIHRQIIEASQSGAAVLVNSTDAEELTVLCDRVLILKAGRVVGQVDRDDLSVQELDRRVLATPTTKAA
jgi:ribose transport system ATP-binding protein